MMNCFRRLRDSVDGLELDGLADLGTVGLGILAMAAARVWLAGRSEECAFVAYSDGTNLFFNIQHHALMMILKLLVAITLTIFMN